MLLRRKFHHIEESWYNDPANIILPKRIDNVKKYLNNVLKNSILNKPITVDVSYDASTKFYNYIGGQLVEGVIGEMLGLTHTANVDLTDTSLDGRFTYLNTEYLLEVKAFKNKISSIGKIFTAKEREKLITTNNSFVIICKYSLDYHTYTVTEFWILSSAELNTKLG